MVCLGLVLDIISFTMTYDLKARGEFEECASFSPKLVSVWCLSVQRSRGDDIPIMGSPFVFIT